jgi:hypothetical protein
LPGAQGNVAQERQQHLGLGAATLLAGLDRGQGQGPFRIVKLSACGCRLACFARVSTPASVFTVKGIASSPNHQE